MAAPQLEIVQDGGGSSPSSSKSTMFKVGKFKVTKPMFYIGGVVLMLLLVIIVKSRSSQVATGAAFYPDGTESIDNGVDVAAQLQNFQNMMGTTLDGHMTQVDNNLNTAMKEMQQQNDLKALEMQQQQNSVISELKSSNQSLQSSLQSMLSNQLNSLKQSYQPVTATYNSGVVPTYQSDGFTFPVSSYESAPTTSWNYNNPAPTENYATSQNQAAYQQQMNSYLNEVNSTRQDAIQYGISTGDWQPERYFESTRTPQNYTYNSSTGNLDYSSEYYKNDEFTSRMAAAAARERGDLATAAIWEKSQQEAIQKMNAAQSSNLAKK